MSSNTKTRRHLFFVGLTFAVLAVFLTQHFGALESSVGRKIERPARAKTPRVFADQALPATIPSVDLPVASATAPLPEPMPAPVQLAR